MRWLWFALLLLALLAGCSLEVPAPPQPVNEQTARALTPTMTFTPAPTATTAPTPTSAPSATIAPAASAAATPTTDPSVQALVDVSYCTRPFGPANGARFSARLQNVRTAQTDDFDQVTFTFSDTTGPLHGTASCLGAAGWPTDTDLGLGIAPGPAIIALDLADWAHDDLFAASPLTDTALISPTGALESIGFAADSLDSRGAQLGIGLSEPRPFRVRVQNNELIVEVARNTAFPPEDDQLGTAAGELPALNAPVFFLYEGDVYRFAAGQAQPISRTAELETGLAVSPDGQTLAVCRAPAAAEPFALPYNVRATLWTMRADGSDPQQLADVGGCAEPSFAASGRTIAFTANIAPVPPAVLQVWTVPVVGGEVMPATTVTDEWSRSQPQWLSDGRLVYRARNDSGQTIIFVRNADGSEQEVTAALLTGPTYDGIGAAVVDSANDQIAVEALRAADAGADLVVLRPDGTQVVAEKRGFWQRPLAFSKGELIYLTAECQSETVLSYTLHRRTAQGNIENVVAGSSAAAIGSAVVQGNTLLYVRVETDRAGIRGPAVTPALDEASSIWGVALDGSARGEVFSAASAIDQLRAAVP